MGIQIGPPPADAKCECCGAPAAITPRWIGFGGVRGLGQDWRGQQCLNKYWVCVNCIGLNDRQFRDASQRNMDLRSKIDDDAFNMLVVGNETLKIAYELLIEHFDLVLSAKKDIRERKSWNFDGHHMKLYCNPEFDAMMAIVERPDPRGLYRVVYHRVLPKVRRSK